MIEVNPAESLILNVDDYVPGRYARTRLLKQAGYRVIEAGSGSETLELVKEHKPALILLDVNLPDISGFEVCRKLRSNPETETLTILHISASSVLTQHQVNGLDSGADGYLVEPVEPAVLLATVNAFLRARRAEEEMRKSNEELRWFSYRVGHDLNEPLRNSSPRIRPAAQTTSAGRGSRTRISQNPLSLLSKAPQKCGFSSKACFAIRRLRRVARQDGPDRLRIRCSNRCVIENLDSSIRDSGARITHDPLPEIAATEQLEYIFQNLISNAIKYRKPDIAPEIHISVRNEDGAWLFSVGDNGIGISNAGVRSGTDL